MVGIYQLSPAHVLKIPDLLLCLSILEMGIDSCVGQELFFSIRIFLPKVLCESPVVSMISPHADSMTLGIAFEC